MPHTNNRTEYCHQQAAECETAATNTALPEVREAYLNIAKAWLQLAPDVASNQTVAERPESDEQAHTPEPNRS
jgi:hypothetical protein